MHICCGASYINRLYGHFEAGSYRVTPKIKDLMSSIKWASSTGFEAIEIEVLTADHLEETFTLENAKILSRLSKEFSVRVPVLSIPFISHVIPTPENWKDTQEKFIHSAEIAGILDVGILSTISPPYPGAELDPETLYPNGPASPTRFHELKRWEDYWASYVAFVRQLADIAESYGLKIAIEPRPRETVGNTDGMLMLLRDAKSSNLGVLFDTAHHFIVKEFLPTSIWRLGKSIFAVHVGDNDGIIEHHWAPGEGRINWIQVLEGLQNLNFDGFLIIESSTINKSGDDFVEGKRRVEKWLRALNKPLEFNTSKPPAELY